MKNPFRLTHIALTPSTIGDPATALCGARKTATTEAGATTRGCVPCLIALSDKAGELQDALFDAVERLTEIGQCSDVTTQAAFRAGPLRTWAANLEANLANDAASDR